MKFFAASLKIFCGTVEFLLDKIVERCYNLFFIKERGLILFELELMYIFRIMLAGICGIVVGLERKNRSKEAGIRTHFVVACGAAIIMVVSKYAFFDVPEIAKQFGFTGEIRLDPSRVASTIASGIGFLGAGMIFVHKNTVTGLTTAAGIWATSGIGMALGAGMYRIGVFTTIIMLVIQYLLHARNRFTKTHKTKLLRVFGVSEEGYEKRMIEMLAQKQISVSDVSIDKSENNEIDYTFHIEIADDKSEEELVREIPYACSLKYVN